MADAENIDKKKLFDLLDEACDFLKKSTNISKQLSYEAATRMLEEKEAEAKRRVIFLHDLCSDEN